MKQINAKEISKEHFGYNISTETKQALMKLIKRDKLINFINNEILILKI